MLRQPVDIKFSSQSLSYAERLMLKKHRRMELGALPDTSSPSSFAVAADKTMTSWIDRIGCIDCPTRTCFSGNALMRFRRMEDYLVCQTGIQKVVATEK